MNKYAKVIVRNNSIYTDNLFTYEIPEFLVDELDVGHRVLVTFGRGNKPTEAFVFEITTTTEEGIKTKEVVDLLDEKPIFKLEDLELVRWMKNRYLCTYIDCINLIYPKGYKLNNYKVVYLNDNLINLENLNEIEKIVVDEIASSKGRIKLDKLKKIKNINNILDRLSKKNIVDIKWEYKDQKNEKKICYISLSMDSEYIDEYISENKINLGSKQKEIIKFLKHNDIVEINDLLEILNASKQSITSLATKNLISLEIKDYYRRPQDLYNSSSKEINLNEEQKYAVNKITSEMFNDNKKPYMIHGVTGSGKTEVYMEIIDYALNQGLDSIVLVPEISLTPQTISRFKNRFGDIVGVFHSQLSEGEKHDVYKAIKLGKIRILIGARSALFAPFNSLGVVIIDEFHEGAYKSEKNPKFNAIEVARYMVMKKNISLVLGSATPSVEEYYKAVNGDYELINIKNRANKSPLPKIEVVDMKQELSNGNKSILSHKLHLEIENAIKNKNQVILFLNRRGYANFVSCRKCGYVFQCENCDISLTYHKGKNIGRCHYCGYEKEMPKECPECKSHYIKPFGTGTQKIEEEIKSIFENVKVLRWIRIQHLKKDH